MKRRLRFSWILLVAAALGGCAALDARKAESNSPLPDMAQLAPAQWSGAPKASAGAAQLVAPSAAPLPSPFWVQLGQAMGDAALVPLIEATIQESADLALARAKLAQAKAARAGAARALRPQLDASANALTQKQSGQRSDVLGAALTGVWAIDLWGGLDAAAHAASAQEDAALLALSQAHSQIAASVAQTLLALRQCEAQLAITQSDVRSRESTAQLNTTLERGGLLAPAQAALARASVAEGQARALAQRIACEDLRRVLAAGAGWSKERLAQTLTPARSKAQQEALAHISEQKRLHVGANGSFSAIENIAIPWDRIPAELLSRRSDVAIAQTQMRAAAAQIIGAAAQGLPSVALTGNIGPSWVRAGGVPRDGINWQIGPIALSLPLTRNDLTRAEVEAAQAGYAAAIAAYKATVRNAVREVEAALDTLAAARERLTLTQTASDGYNATFAATEARHRAGLASTLELEDARRLRLAAETALLDARLGVIASTIALFVATGGGIDASLASAASNPIPSAINASR